MKRVVSVSIPRSGHHLVERLFWGYFEYGSYLYCERYRSVTDSICCGKIPCERVNSLARHSFGDANSIKIFVQKTHDLDLETMIFPEHHYFIQFRHPANVVRSWLQWEVAQGLDVNPGVIISKLFDNFLTYIRFIAKWLYFVPLHYPNAIFQVLTYESLTASSSSFFENAAFLIKKLNEELDEERLRIVVDEIFPVDAHSLNIRERNEFSKNMQLESVFKLIGDEKISDLVGLIAPWINDIYPPRESGSRRNAMVASIFAAMSFGAVGKEKGVVFDFTKNARTNSADSRPVSLVGTGVSFCDEGIGSWTEGSNGFIPFTIRRGVSGVRVKMDMGLQDNMTSIIFRFALVLGGRIQGEHSFPVSLPLDQNRQVSLSVNFDGLTLYDEEEECFLHYYMDQISPATLQDPRNLGVLLTRLEIMPL